MNLSLLFQQCPACHIHLTWMVCEMGGKWIYSCCFVGWCFQDMFKTTCSILVYFFSGLFSIFFVGVHVVHLYSSIDTDTGWKKSHFILSERSDLYVIDNLSIVYHALARSMLTSLSVNEILLQSM